MIPSRIPYEEAGIDEASGIKVSLAIDRILNEWPDRPIDVQKVSESSGVPGGIVKRVFYLFLALRLLKATFLPRHRACDRVIGDWESSVEMINDKARTGQYGSHCMLCAEPIEGEGDIEIQIVFWKPGVDIGR